MILLILLCDLLQMLLQRFINARTGTLRYFSPVQLLVQPMIWVSCEQPPSNIINDLSNHTAFPISGVFCAHVSFRMVNIFAVYVWWHVNYTLHLEQGHKSLVIEGYELCVCNRAKFVSVTEDFMLLGVGVIAVAAFIHHISTWEKVQNGSWILIVIRSVSCEAFKYLWRTQSFWWVGFVRCRSWRSWRE